MGLASVILPRLRVSEAAVSRLNRALKLSGGISSIDVPRLLLLAWLSELSPRSAGLAADRLDLRAESRRMLAAIGGRCRIASGAAAGRRDPGRLALELRTWNAEEAIAAASWLSLARGRRFLERWRLARRIRLRINGDDLIRSGIAPGPPIGRLLDDTWKARFRGRIRSRDELAFALREAGR